jgi:hypothetical protein
VGGGAVVSFNCGMVERAFRSASIKPPSGDICSSRGRKPAVEWEK